jgi:hypothetical protein
MWLTPRLSEYIDVRMVVAEVLVQVELAYASMYCTEFSAKFERFGVVSRE